MKIVDGLLLYKQYLENVRKDILNYDLSTLDSKRFLDILKRVHEIEDLSYIDTILKSAGLDLSFWNSKEFLNKIVEVQSNLGKYYVDEFITEEETEVLNDYISAFADKEDEISDTLDYIYGEDGFGDEDIYADNFISSEDEFPTIETMLESNKDTLGALFGFMKKVEENKESIKEDKDNTEIVEVEENKESIKEDKDNVEIVEDEEKNIMESDDDFTDIDFTNSDFEDFEDIEFEEDDTIILFDEEPIEVDEDKNNISDDLDEEDIIIVEEISVDENIEDSELNEIECDTSSIEEENSITFDDSFDTSFLDEVDEEIDTESIKEKDFSIFLEDKIESNEEVEEHDLTNEADFFEDNTDEELEEDLYEVEEPNIFDRDPESSTRFKEATEFFLNSKRLKKSSKNEIEKLKEQAKQKERLVEHPDVTDGEDALAKVLLSLGLGMMSIPKSTTGLMSKIKEGSKKITENMIVGDEEDEE